MGQSKSATTKFNDSMQTCPELAILFATLKLIRSNASLTYYCPKETVVVLLGYQTGSSANCCSEMQSQIEIVRLLITQRWVNPLQLLQNRSE